MDSQKKEWAELFFKLTLEQRQELFAEMRRRIRAKGRCKVKTYIVKRLEVGDDLGETHGLRLKHGVYVDDDGLRSAVALCYNEPTAELLRDLLADFERQVEAIDRG